MDKLTIISGCLFLAADIFAIASIANPDWINTGESAGERRRAGPGGGLAEGGGRGGETRLRRRRSWRVRGGGRPEERRAEATGTAGPGGRGAEGMEKRRAGREPNPRAEGIGAPG